MQLKPNGKRMLCFVACLAWVHATPAFSQTANVDKEYRIPRPEEALRLLQEFGRHERVKSGSQFFENATVIGSKACGECHQKRYQEWQHTWHSKMERWPSPETVVGDFNDAIVTYKDVKALDLAGKEVPGKKITYSVKAFRDGPNYMMTVLDGGDGSKNQTFRVAKVIGGNWDQAYEVEVGQNYAVAPLRFAIGVNEWLINAFRMYEWVVWENDTWRPRTGDELLTFRFAETKCTGCHASGYTFKKDPHTKRWGISGDGELGITCERCHGPGSAHAAQAREATASGQKLQRGTSTIINPLRDLDGDQQNQVCAQDRKSVV
jgi:hypothetical protein